MKFALKPQGRQVGGQSFSYFDLWLREGKNCERIALISGVRWG